MFKEQNGNTTAVLSVPIKVWKATHNLMTNRYEAPIQLASVEIASAILLVDDDVLLSDGLISGMRDLWEGEGCQHKCMIGLDQRWANPVNKGYEFFPPSHNTSAPANVVINKSAMVYHRFLKAFMADPNLVNRTSLPSNSCEDISLSLAVTNTTGILPKFIPVKSSLDYSSKETIFLSPDDGRPIGSRKNIPEPDGLSITIGKWAGKRSECVRWSLDYFGMNLDMVLVRWWKNNPISA